MQNHFWIWERNIPNESHLKLPWCELHANTCSLWDWVTLSSFRWAILDTSRPQEKDKKIKRPENSNGAILVKEHRSGQLGDNLREYFLKGSGWRKSWLPFNYVVYSDWTWRNGHNIWFASKTSSKDILRLFSARIQRLAYISSQLLVVFKCTDECSWTPIQIKLAWFW